MGKSLPARGEWIEIRNILRNSIRIHRLSPHGESGLKSLCLFCLMLGLKSLPARGEWIEIK